MANLLLALKCLDYLEFDNIPTGALERVKGENFLTFRGINQRDEPDFEGWDKIHSIIKSSSSFSVASGVCHSDIELSNMVFDFYNTKYWLPLNLDDCIEQTRANILFTSAALIGVKTAAVIAQISLGVVPDGSFGKKSIAALNLQELFKVNFPSTLRTYLYGLVINHPNYSLYIKGWNNRLIKVVEYAK